MRQLLITLNIALIAFSCARQSRLPQTTTDSIAVSGQTSAGAAMQRRSETDPVRSYVLSLDSTVQDRSAIAHLLIGIWQEGGYGFAAGWADNYQFFHNGQFRFNHNTMDCAKRELAYSGSWTLGSDELRLEIRQRHVFFGGHLEESYGSCGTDSTLVGAILKTVTLEHPVQQTLRLSVLRVDSLHTEQGRVEWRYYALIDSLVFARMSDDPNDYR